MSNFMENLHAPEYEMVCLFRGVECVKCKQNYTVKDSDLSIFNSIAEIWKAAKKIHKSAPLPCITPELIVFYDLALIPKKMAENKQADFPEIILPNG